MGEEQRDEESFRPAGREGRFFAYATLRLSRIFLAEGNEYVTPQSPF
jgi:hypothetical protein